MSNGVPLDITPRASGGPVTAGRAYVVGERRPELFVPGMSGTILSRVPGVPAAAGSSETKLHITLGVDVDQSGNLKPFVSSVARSEAEPIAQRYAQQAVDTTSRSMQRNLGTDGERRQDARL